MVTSLSGWQLNSASLTHVPETFGTPSTWSQMRVMQALQQIDNSIGANAKWLTKINTDQWDVPARAMIITDCTATVADCAHVIGSSACLTLVVAGKATDVRYPVRAAFRQWLRVVNVVVGADVLAAAWCCAAAALLLHQFGDLGGGVLALGACLACAAVALVLTRNVSVFGAPHGIFRCQTVLILLAMALAALAPSGRLPPRIPPHGDHARPGGVGRMRLRFDCRLPGRGVTSAQPVAFRRHTLFETSRFAAWPRLHGLLKNHAVPQRARLDG